MVCRRGGRIHQRIHQSLTVQRQNALIWTNHIDLTFHHFFPSPHIVNMSNPNLLHNSKVAFYSTRRGHLGFCGQMMS